MPENLSCLAKGLALEEIITGPCGQFGCFISPWELCFQLVWPSPSSVDIYWHLFTAEQLWLTTGNNLHTHYKCSIGTVSIVAPMVNGHMERVGGTGFRSRKFSTALLYLCCFVVGEECMLNCQRFLYVMLMIAVMLNHPTVCGQSNELNVSISHKQLKPKSRPADCLVRSEPFIFSHTL